MEKMEDLRRRLVGDIEGENRYTIGKDIYKDNLSYYEGEPTTYPSIKNINPFIGKAKLSDAKYLDEILENTNRENIDNAIDVMKYYKEKMAEEVGIPKGRFSSNAFPTKQLKEALNKLKQNKMKTKKFYHTFDFKEREITLLLAVKEDEKNIFSSTATVSITYSVRLHNDEEVEGLTKKIALGRLEKGKLLDNFRVDMRFAFKLAYLKGLAFCFENEIKRGDLEIVGVTSGVAKERRTDKEQASQETNENLEQ